MDASRGAVWGPTCTLTNKAESAKSKERRVKILSKLFHSSPIDQIHVGNEREIQVALNCY